MFDETQVGHFLYESNRIDEIHDVLPAEVTAASNFLNGENESLISLERYAKSANYDAVIREFSYQQPLDQLRPGNYPPGGPLMRHQAALILDGARNNTRTPLGSYHEFMTLCPLVWSNGQCGRLLWFWQMNKFCESPRHTFLMHHHNQVLKSMESIPSALTA